MTYLLSPEARDLRPLLVREVVAGLDLAGRDRARRAVDALPGLLALRLPFFGVLPSLPTPPIYVPGLGLMSIADALRCGTRSGSLDLQKWHGGVEVVQAATIPYTL